MQIFGKLTATLTSVLLISVMGCNESKPVPVVVPPTPAAAAVTQPVTPQVAPTTDKAPATPPATSDGVERPVLPDEPVAASTKPTEVRGTKLPPDLLEGSKLTPLNKQGTVLLDFPGKRVLLKTQICLTRGPLEMFLCLKQTKEHESILSLDAEAYTIHGALVALGAKEGQPVKFEPEFQPASGDKIDIFVHWVDTAGKLQRQPAQQWIRHSRDRFHEEKFEELPADLKIDPDSNLRYDPVNKFLIWYGPMTNEERDGLLKLSQDKKYQESIKRFHQEGLPRETNADFVFVGSGFATDGDNGKHYLAEGGYVICVANFTMAMIDIAVASSANGGSESLNFEVFHERLPPAKSEVLVELVVRSEEKKTK